MEWREVAGYNGLYLVSDIGLVQQTAQTLRRMPGILKPQVASVGYHQVQLVVGLDRKFKYVHRLVAEAFIPNPDNLPKTNHINGDKTDNRVENLEWCSQLSNIHHAHMTGLAKRKLTPTDKANIINMRRSGYSLKDLANMFNVSQGAISVITSGKRKIHKLYEALADNILAERMRNVEA